MKHPTKKQIEDAAKTSHQARKALETLYPEIFERPIQAGEIYSWGTDSDGGSGLVIHHPAGEYFSFINFHQGFVYISSISVTTTKSQLNEFIGRLSTKALHNCYAGKIVGPKHISSWCTK